MRKILWPMGLAAALCTPFTALAQADTPPRLAPSLAASLAASPASQPPTQALTLAIAQQWAAERSAVLSAAQHEVQASDGALQQAGARPNPELSASVEDTRRDTRTTTAVFNLPLEMGGKRTARLAAASLARDLARAELQQARAELRSSVITAFFAVLVAQERVTLADASVEIAVRAADATARRVAAGKISPVDASRADVDTANARLEAQEALAELDDARRTLSSLWGDAVPAFGPAQGDLDTLPAAAPADLLIARLDEAPLLAVSRIEIERRLALVGVERSKQTPDLTLSLGAKRDNELGRTQAIVGISVPLPWFDRNQGSVIEASRLADKAGDRHRAAQVALALELRQASSRLAMATSSARTLRSAVLPAAQQAFEATARGFDAGKFAFLDVLDAQRTLLQARARHLRAVAEAFQASAAIGRVLGD